jgi:hypothetical protein
MAKVWPLQEHRIWNRLLVAIKAVSIQNEHGSRVVQLSNGGGAYIFTWTSSSLRSEEWAKEKASILRGGVVGR